MVCTERRIVAVIGLNPDGGTATKVRLRTTVIIDATPGVMMVEMTVVQGDVTALQPQSSSWVALVQRIF